MTRYSYPGGKSISSLSLSLSLRQPPPPAPSPSSPRSCPPHRFSTTPTTRPLPNPLHDPPPCYPTHPWCPRPRASFSDRSCRTIPAVWHRRNRHVVFFLITTPTSLSVFVWIASGVTGDRVLIADGNYYYY